MGLSIPQLREDNKLYAKKLVSKSREVIQTFLEKFNNQLGLLTFYSSNWLCCTKLFLKVSSAI
jgi:hypothetical protein